MTPPRARSTATLLVGTSGNSCGPMGSRMEWSMPEFGVAPPATSEVVSGIGNTATFPTEPMMETTTS